MEMELKNPELWKIAKKRAGFKYHLLAYCFAISFFWILWYVNSKVAAGGSALFPWPLWPMLMWGAGVLFSYLGAYRSFPQLLAESEYQKLTIKQ